MNYASARDRFCKKIDHKYAYEICSSCISRVLKMKNIAVIRNDNA
jgi:hypothetical protein